MKTNFLILFILFVGLYTGVSAQTDEKKPNANGVFVVVEEMPQFPGGEAAFREFVAKNVVYPPQAIKDSITGKVYVTFVIDEKGVVCDARIVRGVHPLLDEEALRVIKSSPAWTPGKQKGVTVKVAYTSPIMFALK